MKTEALFADDDAVLSFESAATGAVGHKKEDDSHDDPPAMGVLVGGPVVDGDVDGEDEVQEEQGDDDEVEERVEAGVILQALRRGHGLTFQVRRNETSIAFLHFFLMMVGRRFW